MWPTDGLPLRYAPAALVTLSLLQVLAFATSESKDLGFHAPTPRPVNALTSLFAHSDAVHLLANVASQLALGVFVEGMHGARRFLLVYVGSGLVGALVYRGHWCMAEAPRHAYLVGASGAVYGLMGAYASHLLINWAELVLRYAWLAAALLTLGVDIALYVLFPQERVAYSAHVGGGVAGVCLGVLALRNVRVLEWERALGVVAGMALAGVCVAAVGSCA